VSEKKKSVSDSEWGEEGEGEGEGEQTFGACFICILLSGRAFKISRTIRLYNYLIEAYASVCVFIYKYIHTYLYIY